MAIYCVALWITIVLPLTGELAAVENVMARGEMGSTPLHLAAQYGAPANIQTLLAAGADIMAR